MEATSCSIRRKWPIVPVWLLLAVSSLHGGSGGVFQMPPPKSPAPSGLRMKVDTQWVSGNGYRPVTVEFSNSPAGTRATDRSLTVVFLPNQEHGTRVDQFTHFVELPAGAPSVTTTISIPQFHEWYTFEILVYEDGVLLDDLSFSSNANSVGRRPARDWSERTPGVLIIDGEAPTRAERFELLHGPNPAGRLSSSFPEDLSDYRC